MRWLAVVLAFAAVLAIVFVGLKVGGEMHYRNCLQRVELEYPAAFAETKRGQYGAVEEGGFQFFQQPERETAVGDCHSWP
jgi:hypothetical protein